MTVLQLLTKSLKRLGNTNPTSEQIADAFDSLNIALNTFAYWDDSINPVRSYAAVTDTVSLPYQYIEVLIMMVAAQEAYSYGADPRFYEAKVKDLQSRIDYPNAQALQMGYSVAEVI